MNNAVTKRRRATRGSKAKGNKKKRDNGQRTTYNVWKPGNAYALLRAGDVLETPPRELENNGALKEAMLWHFKSRSETASRMASVDKVSLYEAAFRLTGMTEGEYLYPTHRQLMQIYKGCDRSKATEINEDGTPRVTDKMLRRYAAERNSRENGNKRAKQRKKNARRTPPTISAATRRKYDNAPVKIDDKISSATPRTTIRSMISAKMWGKPFNPSTLPNKTKQAALHRQIEIILGSLGEAVPLTEEERQEDLDIVRQLREGSTEDGDANDSYADNWIGDDPRIHDNFMESQDELHPCYFPGPDVDDEEDDDIAYRQALNAVKDDLSVSAVETAVRSSRQHLNRAMANYVTDEVYRERHRQKPAPPKRKRPPEEDTDSGTDTEKELDELFESLDQSGEKEAREESESPKKRKTDSPDEKIRRALENKDSVNGIPDWWYKLFEDAGFDAAIAAIKQTSEYKLIAGFLK